MPRLSKYDPVAHGSENSSSRQLNIPNVLSRALKSDMIDILHFCFAVSERSNLNDFCNLWVRGASEVSGFPAKL